MALQPFHERVMQRTECPWCWAKPGKLCSRYNSAIPMTRDIHWHRLEKDRELHPEEYR